MSQSQQHTHKWKPSIGNRVLHVMKGKQSPHNMANLIGETQAAVSVALYNLWQQGRINREACPCGRGFVYWK